MLKLNLLEDKTEFNSFVKQSSDCHYMKTSMYGDVRKTMHRGNSYKLLGFYEDECLVATALLMKEHNFGVPYLYVPKGPCMDYSNPALCKEVFTLLKEYGAKENVAFLKIDPTVEHAHHKLNGEIIEDGYSGEWVTEELKALGFMHRGYNYAYDGSFTNRYTLILDISPAYEEIRKHFKGARKTNLNRHTIFGVKGEIATKDDLPELMRFEKQLSEIDGFKPHKKEFFETWLNAFGQDAILYKVTVDFKEMAEGLSRELENKKYKKDPEAKAAIAAFQSETDKALEKYGPGRRIVAMGLFLRYGNGSWDLYTYNDKEFGFLKATDAMHAIAIEDMKAHGVTNYDMCGFSGVVDSKDPEYGLYLYKSSFGPRYVEMIGEFDTVYRSRQMKRFKDGKRIQNGIRRRVNARIYKKK